MQCFGRSYERRREAVKTKERAELIGEHTRREKNKRQGKSIQIGTARCLPAAPHFKMVSQVK